VGDWKKHDLSPTAPQEPEQHCGHRIQNNGLTSYEQDGDDCIKDAMLRFELVQPIAQKMQDQEKISGDKNRIDGQLDCKHAQAFGTVFLHEESVEGLKRYGL